MAILRWNTTREECDLISKIALRASRDAEAYGIAYSAWDCNMDIMDITAAHLNAYRLDLAGLLVAEPLDFTHDVFGIRRHLNRDTGKLEDCFVPRFALGEVA